MSQIRVNINGKEIVTYKGHTILEVARQHNIDIPTLCQNDKLKNYGSCGICVVEVEGNPRLIRSCSTDISDGMIINTNTNRVKESRKTTLELLLSNHEGDCKAPCSMGCPAHVDVQGYVGLIANEEYDEALKLIKEELPLPASIGRVCPHPCQTACRRGIVDDSINIAWLKRYVADMDLEKEESYIPEIAPSTGKKIAIIGGGPAGLTSAFYLRKMGHDVVVYEAMPEFGGMLKYGIPLYRLPKEVLLGEVKLVEKMGVKLIPNIKIGRDMSLNHIRQNFDACFVAIGAWKSAELRCEGALHDGVFGGIDFLNKFAINDPIKVGERVAVIGGGNTAMDAARTAIRLGAKEVYAIYRRTKVDMPAEDVEVHEAEEEGVTFKFLRNPVEVLSNSSGRVSQVRLEVMEQTEADASGRIGVRPVEGEFETLEVDSVIVSIGQRLNNVGLEEISLNERGNIDADASYYTTNLEGVFAGGDCTNKGADIAIQAIADAKNAAFVIDTYLKGEMVPHKEKYIVERKGLTREDFPMVGIENAAFMGHEGSEIRKTNFEEIVHGYVEANALKEASRCLECGCHDSFECDLYKQANEYDVEPERWDGDKIAFPHETSHPFIQRDPNKCILCGMCVRICDEVMDNTALGLVDRGFESVVKPALDQSLAATDCISCGQCISVCPVGALQEKLTIKKPVPVKEKATHSVCSHCSVGCHIDIKSKGDLLLRALPIDDSIVSEGLLCAKGRFGITRENDGRILYPMVRKDGELVEVSFKEALLYVARRAQSLHLLYGKQSLGIAVSDRYTNEEIYLTKAFARDVLDTKNVMSFNSRKSGLKEVLGYDASSNVINELYNTDMIINVGANIVEDHTIAGLKIKKAIQNGSDYYVINNESSKSDAWANEVISTHDIMSILKQLAKYILTSGVKMPKVNNLEAFTKSLSDVVVSPVVATMGAKYVEQRKAMIVFDQQRVTEEVAAMIANIAVLSGHIGSARDGIIQLKPNANSQGLVDMGIDTDAQKYIELIKNDGIKGMLVFGESIDPDLLDGVEFLMVQDTHMTELAKVADVILPAATLSESNGTVTACDRKIQFVNQAVTPKIGKENWEILRDMMNTFSINFEAESHQDILEVMSREVTEYTGIMAKLNQEVYWPIKESRVMYQQKFNTSDGLANLQVCNSSGGIVVIENTNNMTTRFADWLFNELK